MPVMVEGGRESGDGGGGGGVALQFYKYTDVLTNTHPDTYTQSHLFQSRRRAGSGK